MRLLDFPVFLFALLLCCAVPAFPAAAQEAAAQESAAEESDPNPPAPDIGESAIIAEEDGYVTTSFPNLSQLYWVLGKTDLSSDEDVDNFVLINECDMYQKYINNDFEWANLREAMRSSIEKKMVSFPRRFEVMHPIYLSNYDVDKEEFSLRPESAMINTRRIEVAMNNQKKLCGRQGEINNYPRNILLVLNVPFTFIKVPVSPAIAEMYLSEVSAQFENLPSRLRLDKYQRVAYIRLKVMISQYKETVRMRSRGKVAVVMGYVEGVEVYADPDKLKLMYKTDVRTRNLRRVNRYSQQGKDIHVVKPPLSKAPDSEAREIESINEIKLEPAESSGSDTESNDDESSEPGGDGEPEASGHDQNSQSPPAATGAASAPAPTEQPPPATAPEQPATQSPF